MLANLNLSGLTNLTGLYLSYNNFSTINLSGLTNLWQLDINNNKLTTLDLSSNVISSF
jgi:Leucine-rich repeat (LRR) protein